MIRLAVSPANGKSAVLFDRRREMAGRGAWLCADNPDCLAKARLKGRLAKALKTADLDLSLLTGE
jgi:predicted RNA-binding protein YlxR (DUF448 family)